MEIIDELNENKLEWNLELWLHSKSIINALKSERCRWMEVDTKNYCNHGILKIYKLLTQ